WHLRTGWCCNACPYAIPTLFLRLRVRDQNLLFHLEVRSELASTLTASSPAFSNSAKQTSPETAACGSTAAPGATLPQASQTGCPDAHTRPTPPPAPASLTPENSPPLSPQSAAPAY